MNILEEFYILFKSDADKARKETDALKTASEASAAAVDATAVSYAAAAAAGVEAQQAVIAATLTGIATTEAEAAAIDAANVAHAASILGVVVPAIEVETAAVEAESAAYVFNRMQRQELVGLARHSFDQLASGGSLMRVVSSHAATLAEALGSGEGGLSAGLSALATAAGKFVRTFGLPIAAIAALVATLGVARGSVKDLEETRLMAGRLNMKVDDLDAMRKVVRKLGGDTKETDRDLERFANRLDDAFGNAAVGKPDRVAKTMAGLKVSTHDANGKLKDTKTALLDIAGALEHVDAKHKSEALRNLGFSSPRHGQTDPAIEKMLLSGRAAMEQYIDTEKRLGGVTEAQVEAAHKYKLATEELGDRWRDFRNTIAEYVLPILTGLFTGLREGAEWVKLNSTLVKGFGLAFVAMAVIVSAATWGTLIPAFAAAAVAVIAATWPILLIGAAVLAVAAAFATAYEDVKFFLNGQPSLLGELINKYAWVRKTVHAIGDAFSWIGKTSKEVWAAVVSGAKAFGEWIGPFFKGLGEIIGPTFRLIIDVAVALAKVLGPVIGGALKFLITLLFGIVKEFASTAKQLGQLIGAAFSAVAKFIGPIWDEMFKGWLRQLYLLIAGVRTLFNLKPDMAVNSALNPAAAAALAPGVAHGQSLLTAARTAPLAAVTSASLANHRPTVHKHMSVHIDKVDVHTQATDADGIARGVKSALTDHLRSATAAFDDGTDR